ncbi:MAG: hypothetical protein KGM24_05710 [Elusimicrobia bacterium]|nr:hypothetical protein [Elusimicrobiota bacterium]
MRPSRVTAALVLLTLPALAGLARAGMPGGTADLVLGQGLFTTRGLSSFPNAYGFNLWTQAGGQVAIDTANARVYVADQGDSRVLFWNGLSALASGRPADGVLGQDGFLATGSGTSAGALSDPGGLAVDGAGNLWVADYGNNRVLRFPAPVTSGESADLVLGQPDFTADLAATSATAFSNPSALAFAADGSLWVADQGNRRVLRFSPPFSTDESADLALGQGDFTSSVSSVAATGLDAPRALAFAPSGSLLVSDSVRVLEYDAPFSTGMAAAVVLGQADFASSAAGIAASSVSASVGGVAVDAAGNVWAVDDGSNRVLRYDAPLSTGMAASLVLGQADFVSSAPATTAAGLKTPVAVALDASGGVWVVDAGNQRVVRYSTPAADGAAGDLLVGQGSFVQAQRYGFNATGMNLPYDAVADPAHGRLFVADQRDDRVLVWNSLSALSSGRAADAVLGQPDAYTSAAAGSPSAANLNQPAALAVDSSGAVWVADQDFNRVLRFSPPFSTGMDADLVIGQPDFASQCATHPSANCLYVPTGLAFDPSGNLWVSGNDRVLRFPKPFSSGESADLAIGEPNLTSAGPGLTATGLNAPAKIAFDAAGDLWVTDAAGAGQTANRVLRYDVPLSTGMAAALVLGQVDFVSSAAATTASGLALPLGVAVDSDGRVWVADHDNQRVLRYDLPLSSGMAASAVYGQSGFTTKAQATSISGLTNPASVSIDSNGNMWIADSDNDRVLEVLRASTGTLGADGGVLTYATSRGTVTVHVPAGAFAGGGTLSLSIPASVPSAPSSAGALTPTGDAVALDLGSGGAEPSRSVSLTVPYAASDVSGLDAARLVLARYDPGDGVWTPYASSVDQADRLVTAEVNHFSIYQVMQAAPGGSVGGAKIFPNPFRPALGHTEVTFSDLPAGATLTIYTLLGERIADLTADAAGQAAWDGTTRAGRRAASGVYFVLVRGGSAHAVYKLAVQR